MAPSRADVARMIDHTILKPEATAADVEQLCRDAVELGVCAVCVSPSFLPIPGDLLAGSGVLVCTVVGFPSGAHQPSAKASEAALAVAQGADEVDMVINLGMAMERRWADMAAEIAAVRAEVPAPKVLKVILETGALTPDRIEAACRASEEAGADFVKTSTGFHPSGGATVEAISVMHATVGGRLGIKASGGVRTAEAALAVIAAGATRIGTSSTAAILDGI